LGNLSSKLGEYDKAVNYYRSAPNQIGLADVFHKTNQPDSAIYYGKIGLKNSQIHKIPINIQACAKILAEELKISDPQAAYEYLNIYINSKDSLYNIEKLKQGEEIKLNEQKNKYELQKLETASRNRMMLIIFSTILCFFSVISYLLWKNNRFKQKANIQLTTTLNELKSTQAQLIQSEKMASLGELTAGIAHEIQNPLNFVNNFSEVSNELIDEVLGERKKEKGKRDEAMEDEILGDLKQNLLKINHHGKRASEIVKGMLEHSRTSTGQKEPTDINALCDEYLRLAYHGLRAKDKSFNATMESNFDPNLPKIDIIPQDIGRVILNLINNAFYAVNEKANLLNLAKQSRNANLTDLAYQPTVSITTSRVDSPLGARGELGKGDYIQISIKDNGSGIPAHIKDKIFQPFFTTKPTGQGTGLGLSLSYDIVKAHGGELKVETTEGKMTAFTILLKIL
jgi:signal transduction histidine kinase